MGERVGSSGDIPREDQQRQHAEATANVKQADGDRGRGGLLLYEQGEDEFGEDEDDAAGEIAGVDVVAGEGVGSRWPEWLRSSTITS
jgi:hypothetical protein